MKYKFTVPLYLVDKKTVFGLKILNFKSHSILSNAERFLYSSFSFDNLQFLSLCVCTNAPGQPFSKYNCEALNLCNTRLASLDLTACIPVWDVTCCKGPIEFLKASDNVKKEDKIENAPLYAHHVLMNIHPAHLLTPYV